MSCTPTGMLFIQYPCRFVFLGDFGLISRIASLQSACKTPSLAARPCLALRKIIAKGYITLISGKPPISNKTFSKKV